MKTYAWYALAVVLFLGSFALFGSGPTYVQALDNGQVQTAVSEPEALAHVLQPFAQIQIAHLAPFAMDPGTSVTVTLDATPVLTNFEFADSTGYISVTTGTHQIQIFAGDSMTPTISETVDLTETFYTAIAVGGANTWPLELNLLVDESMPPAAGNVSVRIGHLAPFTDTTTGTEADVRLQDGTVIVDDVAYDEVEDYLDLSAGRYDLKITTPDGATTLIDPLLVTLNEGDILSIFAVGDGVNQPLGVFVLPSGAPGFLLPLANELYYLPLVPKTDVP